MLLAEELLGGFANRREAREVELQKHGLLPRRRFELSDCSVGLRSVSRSEIHFSVVLQENFDGLFAQASIASYRQTIVSALSCP